MNTAQPGTGIDVGNMITIFEQHLIDLGMVGGETVPAKPMAFPPLVFWLNHKGLISIQLKFGLGVSLPFGLLALKPAKQEDARRRRTDKTIPSFILLNVMDHEYRITFCILKETRENPQDFLFFQHPSKQKRTYPKVSAF
jgi:hypothetical protein